jgi:hypothetical protein
MEFIWQEILEQELSVVRNQLKQTTDRSDELGKVTLSLLTLSL